MNTNNIDESNVKYLIEIAVQKHQSGKLDEAIACYEKALQMQPNHAAYHNLAYILEQKGKLEQAIETYQQALKFEDNAITHNNLGNLYKSIHQFDAAVESYQKAIKLDPNVDYFYYNLGTAFGEQNKLDAAVEAFEKAVKLTPTNHLAKFGICFSQLPIIYQSVDEIKLRRNQYQEHLLLLANSYNKANQEEQAEAAKVIGSAQPFYLAYQGLNDRALQQTYGEMLCKLMESRYPQWCQHEVGIPQLAANEKIRIGFVSKYFFNHSNWKIPIKGWVENLDKSEFELFGYHTGIERDQVTAKAAKVFDKFTQGRLLLEQWCELIKKDNLHILIFPELGMDQMTLQLGCLRLAPIQVTSWGHPNTSGLPTIDYYLSSDLMEPENAESHYTEKLVRLPNLSIHYTPLAIEPEAKTQQEIGVAPEEIMYWCCQSLFKYLPQHDDIFPRISQELPNTKFVFIQHHTEYVTQIFRQRLKNAFEEFGLNYQDYCIFLPRLDVREFASTAAIADVFLDSVGWSGCNSTLEAITHNIPVVTIESDLMRGRHSMAILKMMGIEETIAATKEDYIKIAIHLGTDYQYRQYISRQVAENKQKLYADLKPVRALEDFFFKVVNKSRRFVAKEVADIIQLAVQYQRANRLVEAQQLYHQVLEKYPHHPEALYNLGMLANELGEPESALTWLTTATQVQPDVKIWFSLGNLRLAREEYSEAVIAYRQALALRQDSLAIYNNLGYALQQQGLLSEAVDCYQQALEIKSDFIEAKASLGNALLALGKLSNSEKLYYAQLNYQLGGQRKKAGDFHTAIAYYRQAISLQPDMLEAYCDLAAVQQAQGKREEAICTYRQGLSIVNPFYAKTAEAYSDFAVALGEHITPPITLSEIIVGSYNFPAIAPVADNTESRPFWSVVITVYNRTEYLLECLATVLAQWQGEEHMEIIVIDDASTTPVFEVVDSIGRGIIRYYRNPKNLGLPGNWNAGIALTRGRWIHLLHDDDYILPNFYSQLQKSLEGCANTIGAAFTGYENINEQGKVIFRQQACGQQRGIAENWLQKIGVANSLNMPAVVIRRTAHEQLGLYHPELTYTSDWELYIRIAANYDWWYEPDILARYREHSQSKTTELLLSGTQMTSIRQAIEISESYLLVDNRTEITAQARKFYFQYCLQHTVIPLQQDNLSAALRMLEEAVKIDSSPETVLELFTCLTRSEFAPLGREIASRLVLLPLPQYS